jgi:hypothetical protein
LRAAKVNHTIAVTLASITEFHCEKKSLLVFLEEKMPTFSPKSSRANTLHKIHQNSSEMSTQKSQMYNQAPQEQ